nr:SDR family oxidoreductase [Parafrankia soli]
MTTDDRTFDRVYAVNVKAPFFLTQAVAPAMVAAGEGVIINLGSWAAEFGPLGVRVNAVSPGVIRTPDLDAAVEHPAEAMMRGTPAGGSGHPDAIAAVYLASDDAAFIHGTVLDVDGGRMAVAVIDSAA